MEWGISLYPEFLESALLHSYVEQAASLGCRRVFMSLILDRLHFSGALSPESEDFDRVFSLCRDKGLAVTVDVDDVLLSTLAGTTEEAVAQLARRGVDCLRIDSGVSTPLLDAAKRHGLRLEVNAADLDVSTPKRRRAGEILLETILTRFDPQAVQGCFNFYPRTGTGLSLRSVSDTAVFLHSYGIQTAAFVSSLTAKPVLHQPGRGVCTVEVLRDTPPEIAAAVLGCCGVDAVLFGDVSAAPAELTALSAACAGEAISLPVVFHRDCPEHIRYALTHTTFSNRSDPPEFVLRGTETRDIPVQPFRTGPRPPFCVTVDNCRSAQYMGEMQIPLEALPPCCEANVVGWVLPDAQILVPFLRDGSRQFLLTEYAG